MAKNERFKKVYSQGAMTGTEIWVDRETGVNYVFHFSGYAGGLTPLPDKDGKPVVTLVEDWCYGKFEQFWVLEFRHIKREI